MRGKLIYNLSGGGDPGSSSFYLEEGVLAHLPYLEHFRHVDGLGDGAKLTVVSWLLCISFLALVYGVYMWGFVVLLGIRLLSPSSSILQVGNDNCHQDTYIIG